MLILNIVYALALLWFLVVLAAYLIPFAFGLPPTPTRKERIRRALELAQLKEGERFYDLGCGDGRVLVMAARDFGAQATGIDAGPVQCLQSWISSRVHGVHSNVHVKWGNFFREDLSQADVVFAYLTSGYASRLEAQLASQLKAGARVVTISFDFPDWEPSDFDERDLIFLYRMPPSKGNLESYLHKQG
jgi:SAM-dependent methyltransferase